MTSVSRYSVQLLAATFAFCVVGAQAQVQIQMKPGVKQDMKKDMQQMQPMQQQKIAPSAPVAAPVLTKIESSVEGYVLLGKGFGADSMKVQVLEGTTQVSQSALTSVSDDRIVVKSRPSGTVAIKVAIGGQASNSMSFTLTGVQAQVQTQPGVAPQMQRPAATPLAPAPASVEIVALSATPAAPKQAVRGKTVDAAEVGKTRQTREVEGLTKAADPKSALGKQLQSESSKAIMDKSGANPLDGAPKSTVSSSVVVGGQSSTVAGLALKPSPAASLGAQARLTLPPSLTQTVTTQALAMTGRGGAVGAPPPVPSLTQTVTTQALSMTGRGGAVGVPAPAPSLTQTVTTAPLNMTGSP